MEFSNEFIDNYLNYHTMYKPETKKEGENTRKIAVGFAVFLLLAIVALIAKTFGLF